MVLFDNIEDFFHYFRDLSEYTRAITTLATTVGALFLIVLSFKASYSLFNGFRLYVFNQYCLKTNFVKKYGKWAIITGATDGIGLCMAKELAQRGLSIIIVGRNEEKLAKSKAIVEAEQNGGEVVTIKIDLSDSSLDNYESIKSQIDADNRDIGILINNAGTFPGQFMPLTQFDIKDTRDIVNVNILGTVFFTRLILPSMLKRGKGLIVNVSSIISFLPFGYNNAYAPSKTYVNAFSEMLQNELSSYPIDVINLTPGGIFTKLFVAATEYSKPNCLYPTAEDYAKSTINAIATPLLTMSGTLTHGIICKLTLITNYIGITPYIYKSAIKLAARDFKTKQVIEQE